MLAENEEGEIREIAKVEQFLPVNFGALLFEVRTDLDVPAYLRELEIESGTTTVCPSGSIAIWLPGFIHPEQVKKALLKRAEEEGRRLEVVKWVGYWPQAAMERLRERCLDSRECAVLAERAPIMARCYALHILDMDAWPYERCLKLPPAETRCAFPALLRNDPEEKRRCLQKLGSLP